MATDPARPVVRSLTAPLWTAAPSQVLSTPNLLKQSVVSWSRQAAQLLPLPGFGQQGTHLGLRQALTAFWVQRHLSPEEKAKSIRKLGQSPDARPWLWQRLQEKELSEAETLALVDTLVQNLPADSAGLEEFSRLQERFWSQHPYQQALFLAVGQNRHPEACVFLKQAYRQAKHQPALVPSIIRALGLDGSADAVATLIQIYRQQHQDPKLQRAVIRALGYSQSAASARILEQLLQQAASLESRKLIYRALAATASDTAVEILRQSLKANLQSEETAAIRQAIQRAYGD